ncbi:thiol:disulfide interchange protein DsbA/DsbL [Alteromonas sp. 5E99-2]|uniref:thiol:disulfide interchange protein DsbA/DsbL n=1 Tax=Alteromonas sp. 5E99-2 TaxID=2817683 RepID=UPI001A992737|nr:thiol:disulfide interchange protein DsbA/DsbL [Alteromonas sp. 5E99-2]MBO1256991.1 thiol:disulfide interchange protein DsbA/DsbL [Alteromonas sp. 5E99-2]
MFNKLVTGSFSFLLLVCSSVCVSQEWKEGVHYKVLSENLEETNEVYEFFSFWCPHCYNFEPFLKNLDERLKKTEYKITKVHVNFMGFSPKNQQEYATQTMATAEVLSIEEDAINSLFERFHVQRKRNLSEKDALELLNVIVNDKDLVNKAWSSFTTNRKFNQNDRLMKQYLKDVKAVPTFIVSGKYKILPFKGATPEKINDLILWLIGNS